MFFYYPSSSIQVADGVVIIISFTLDLYFIDGVSGGDGVNNGATVLVILLLWRILRVFNGMVTKLPLEQQDIFEKHFPLPNNSTGCQLHSF